MGVDTLSLIDPSLNYRPEKDAKDFRVFDQKGKYFDRVKKTYYDMHTHQTVDFVRAKIEEYSKFNKREMTIMEAINLLDGLIDPSDPDVDVPNSVHLYQTAERIRELYPDLDWFHLVGLIHDVGKVLYFLGEPEWAVVGDTFVVGCLPPNDEVVFGLDSFQKNTDITNEQYKTKNGMYKENIGIENLLLSWGHDEYMYRVLKNHPSCCLPEQALHMIRFHSFYPWHTAGAYQHFSNGQRDEEIKKWTLEFNKFDLYSKADSHPDAAALKPYYQGLIDKYIPGVIKF